MTRVRTVRREGGMYAEHPAVAAVRDRLRRGVRQGWEQSSLCPEIGSEAFELVAGSRPTRTQLRVCLGCPMRRSCLATAIAEWDELEQGNVRATTSTTQRERLLLELVAGADLRATFDATFAAAQAVVDRGE